MDDKYYLVQVSLCRPYYVDCQEVWWQIHSSFVCKGCPLEWFKTFVEKNRDKDVVLEKSIKEYLERVDLLSFQEISKEFYDNWNDFHKRADA